MLDLILNNTMRCMYIFLEKPIAPIYILYIYVVGISEVFSRNVTNFFFAVYIDLPGGNVENGDVN